MSAEANSEKVRIISPVFQASYVHLDKPAGMPKDPPEKWKFSVTMLYDKEDALECLDVGTKEPISLGKAIARAKRLYFEPLFGPDKSKWPECASPRSDGDTPNKKTGKPNEGHAGKWVYKATSNRDSQPQIVAADDKTLIDPKDTNGLYSGCYARARIWVRVWEYGGKYGVHFILDGVQKAGEGKRFGGKTPAVGSFGALAGASASSEDDGDGEDF